MSIHLGFYNTATTRTHVRFTFSTHAAAGGNVAPNSAFEAADLRIYRANDSAANSATQRSSANGITMTSPFDSLTGVHDVDIDLTDNTDAGFYAAGYQYTVVLAPDETVDGQTITGIMLAYFEIGVQPVNVAQFGGTAGTFASGRPEVNTSHAAGTAWGSGAITSGVFAADAITAAKIHADVSTELNAGVLAVLGALNDAAADGAVTTTDTVMAYIKQLINVLEGGPGIVTFPASATPGDGVSLAEVIRQIYDEVAGLNGGALLDAAGVRSAVGLASANLDTQLTAIDDFLDTEVAAILAAVDTEIAALIASSIIRTNTAQAGAAGTITLDASASASDDFYNNTIIVITAGTGAGQSRIISDYVGSSKVATVNGNWVTNPSSDSVFYILPFGSIPGASAPTAAQVADAVWEEQIGDHSGVAGSTAEQLAAAGAAGDPWATAVPGAYGAGTAGKILGDNLNATVSSRASQTSLDTLDDFVDTEINTLLTRLGTPSDLGGGATVAANLSDIEAQTDDIGVAGAGLTAVPWNASWDAEVQSEAEDAIIAHNLDHLVGNATGIPAIPAGTYIDQMMDDGTAAYDRTTDSLQAIRDRGDAGWATVAAAAIRSAVGLASANLDTQLAAIDDFLDTEVAAILAAVDTEVAAILADTDALETRLTAALAAKLAAHAAGVLTVLTAAGSTTTNVVLNSTTGINGAAPSAVADFYNGRVLIFTSGALDGQATSVTDYIEDNLTVVALTGAPASGVTGVLV